MISVAQCYDDLHQDSSMTFYITCCHNVTVQTGASFNMKQDTVQKTCECIVTSTAIITFDITNCKKHESTKDELRVIHMHYTYSVQVPMLGDFILKYMNY